ncbi:MAG: metallophosphoesterase [Acidimicrobiales bacterium]
MVRWLSPRELVSAGLRVVLSGLFGTYADKREIQAALPPPEAYDASGRNELWFDFVADLADGFNPTYAIASLLAEEKLDLAGPGGITVPTERGSILVMGGDEVYPTASTEEYRNRLLGPYRAALPYTDPQHPHLFAIPGNHDWYDGLTSFMRVFCQGNWVGGWQTSQRRSYFAVALPHRWWLWGIDIQFDTYIDEPQVSYFRDVVGPAVQPGDSVILCSAKPSWVEANEAATPDAFVTLDFFERTTVRRRQAEVRLSLTGDSHHYARYQAANGAQKITAGGGGAFLSATHHLPDPVLLPPPTSTDPGRTTPPNRFDLAISYPSRQESLRVAKGIVTLPRKNPSFAGLLAAVHVLFAWMLLASVRPSGVSYAEAMHDLSITGIAAGLARSSTAMVVASILVVGLAGFTEAGSRRLRWALGSAHTALHLAAVVVAARLCELPLSGVDGAPFLLLYLPLVAVAGGLAGSMVMALYLYVADKLGCNTNELFAAQRIEDKKGFLRLHVGDDGAVTVYPVKLETVPKKWRLMPEGRPDDPWFVADGEPVQPRLIEPPLRVTPAGG